MSGKYVLFLILLNYLMYLVMKKKDLGRQQIQFIPYLGNKRK